MDNLVDQLQDADAVRMEVESGTTGQKMPVVCFRYENSSRKAADSHHTDGVMSVR